MITDESVMHAAFARAMPDVDRRAIYEWAADYITLPSSYVIPGPFDVSISRYMVEPFNAVYDDRFREVDVAAAVQTGKSLFLEICAFWLLSNQPASMMWTMQSDEDAKEYCKTRFHELLKRCAPLQAMMPSDRHMKNTQEIYFGGFFLLINGANLNNLQSKSIRHKLNDEVWLWKQGLLEHAKNRVNAFRDADCSRVLNVSQAGRAGEDWHEQWVNGSQEIWSITCPSCGESLPLTRDAGTGDEKLGLVWDFEACDEDGKWDVARCAETAHYACACGHKWDDSDKTRAEWNRTGHYVVTNETANPVHRSFSWNALVRTAMGELVKKLTEAHNMKRRGATEPLANCLMQDFSEWVSEETFADVVEVTLGNYQMADYFDGEARIDGEVKRFMSVDRQQNRYYAVVRAYRADGSSRLVWATQTQTKEQLREMQLRMGVGDWCVGLDSSYQTEDCYRICAEYKWIALEGSEHAQEWRHKDGTRRFFSPHQRNKTDMGLCNRHLFGGERVKDMLGRFRDMPDFWEVPADPPAEYEESVSGSEAKKEIVNKRTGRPQWKWVAVKKSVNHYWDCEVMNLAMGMIHNVVGSVAGRMKQGKAEKAAIAQDERRVEDVREGAGIDSEIESAVVKEEEISITKPTAAPKRRRRVFQSGKSWATSW